MFIGEAYRQVNLHRDDRPIARTVPVWCWCGLATLNTWGIPADVIIGARDHICILGVKIDLHGHKGVDFVPFDDVKDWQQYAKRTWLPMPFAISE